MSIKPQTIMTDAPDEHVAALKEYMELCELRASLKPKIDKLKETLKGLAVEDDHNYIFGDIRLRRNKKDKISIVKSGFDNLSPEVIKILWNNSAITKYNSEELTVNIVKRK